MHRQTLYALSELETMTFGLKEIKQLWLTISEINNQVNYDRQILQATTFIGTALLNLFRKGVGEQEIVGINQLIQDYAIHALQWRPNHEEKDSLVKGNKEGNISKWELWRSFTDEHKRYGGIKFAIKDQSEKLEKIKKEISDLAIQKQDSLTCFQLAIYLLML